MDIESVRSYCLSLPHVTEKIQWGNDLLFCLGGKMFAVIVLDEASPNRLTFKCTPEKFAELVELENIIPAPYAARYHWVALQSWDALSRTEIADLISNSSKMVLAKLPKKIQAALEQTELQTKNSVPGKTKRRK